MRTLGDPRTQVRIVSDGDGPTSKVLLPDGTELKGVRSVTIWIEASDINRASIDIDTPKLDVNADLAEVTLWCPVCGHTASHECPESTD